MGSFLPNPSWWVSSRRVLGSCWTGVQRICWNRKRKRNMRNMHGGGFPNATYWVCTQTGTDADLFEPLSPAAHRLIRPTGFSQRQSATGGAGASGDAAYTQPRLRHRRGFYYTSQSLSTVWSSVSECQQQHVLSLSFHFSCHCRSRSSRYLYSKVKPSFFRWPHFS